MIAEKVKAIVKPMAQKHNQQSEIYPNCTTPSRLNSPSATLFFTDRLEAGMWNILCLLEGSDAAETEKGQGWGVFDSYLRRYVGVIHGEGR
jgi:hypothetical protein